VTITVSPIMRYSPLSILCEKRPELSFPTSVTPFSVAALLALAKSNEGLAEVSMLKVLGMPVSYRVYTFVTLVAIRKHLPSRSEVHVKRAKDCIAPQ